MNKKFSCASFVLILLLATPQIFAAGDSNEDELATGQEEQENSKSFLKDNEQLLHILRSLLHVPSIVTLDSESPKMIANTAKLACIATSVRFISELLKSRSESSLLKNILLYLPKAGAYAGCSIYEYGRIVKASEVAERNKVTKKQVSRLQFEQSVQLIIELLLRFIAHQSTHETDTISMKSILLAELADLIEIWRLFSRYDTFFFEDDPETKKKTKNLELHLHL